MHASNPFTEAQRQQLDEYAEQLRFYNRRINLLSRHSTPEDIRRHVDHCLLLAQPGFPAGTRLVDWGTGGGLPAIPLAIVHGNVEVVAIDAVGKKIQAVRAIARTLGLSNLTAWHGRAETWPGQTIYSVSRATAPLSMLWKWHLRVAEPASSKSDYWKPGLVCLKGGDLTQECKELVEAYPDTRIDAQPLHSLSDEKEWADKVILSVHTEP